MILRKTRTKIDKWKVQNILGKELDFVYFTDHIVIRIRKPFAKIALLCTIKSLIMTKHKSRI